MLSHHIQISDYYIKISKHIIVIAYQSIGKNEIWYAWKTFKSFILRLLCENATDWIILDREKYIH